MNDKNRDKGIKMENNYLPFEDAKKYVYNLSLNNLEDWLLYIDDKLDYLVKKPSNIPTTPNIVYKDNGWISWDDWFGKNTNENEAETIIKRISNKNIADNLFEYLSKKNECKEKMIKLGYVNPKNKEIAKFYLRTILQKIIDIAFEYYKIEIEAVKKEGLTFSYSIKKSSNHNIEFEKEFRNLCKDYEILLHLISINNLSIRIKLFDYTNTKSILDNLTKIIVVDDKELSLKAAINSLDKDLNDIQYLSKIKSYLKLVKMKQS